MAKKEKKHTYELVKVKGGWKVYNTKSKKYYSDEPQTKKEAEEQQKRLRFLVGTAKKNIPRNKPIPRNKWKAGGVVRGKK